MIEDRAFQVPPGRIVKTGYVEVHKCRLACRERMAIGDVDRAYQKVLQRGNQQSWPPPNGHWEGDTFVILDGRHEYIASVMIGLDWLFVAWLDTESPA